MNKPRGNITPIEQPRCSRCGHRKPESELGGFDPFAPVGKKYVNAYCRELTECDSQEAKRAVEALLKPQN